MIWEYVLQSNSWICRLKVCPRSSDPFYIVTYHIKWVTGHTVVLKVKVRFFSYTYDLRVHTPKQFLNMPSYMSDLMSTIRSSWFLYIKVTRPVFLSEHKWYLALVQQSQILSDLSLFMAILTPVIRLFYTILCSKFQNKFKTKKSDVVYIIQDTLLILTRHNVKNCREI